MKLPEYLEINRLTITALAAQCKLDYFQVYRVVQGKLPPFKNAYQIVHATKGHIGYEDLIPEKVKTDIQEKIRQAQ